MDGVGNELTVTNRLAVAEQLAALVTVTVYVVVVVGDTEMAAVVAELFQLYEVPPLAVKVALAPLQIVTVAGAIAAVGLLFTVTKRLAVALQLLASVTVTVYVVVDAGETVTCALVPRLLLQL